MDTWTKLDKFAFAVFVILPFGVTAWWEWYRIDSYNSSILLVLLLPFLAALVGFSLWLSYYETKQSN